MNSQTKIVASAKARTEAVKTAIAAAMDVMDRETAAADGIYPGNGGRVSVAEVCRRAGVSPITVHGEQHRTTTLIEVRDWIKERARKGPISRKSAKSAAAGHVHEWKSRYQEIAGEFKRMYSIEILQRDAKLAAQAEEIERLRLELAASRSSHGNVVGISSRKKGG